MARKDLAISFKKHPLTNDITSISGSGAIDVSIRNIVLTSFNERKRDPSFGTGIRSALFSLESGVAAQSLKSTIETALSIYEPNVGIISITVDYQNTSEIDVSIIYTYGTNPSEQTTSVSLAV